MRILRATVITGLLALGLQAQTVPNAVLAPGPYRTFTDANGAPLAGGKLYTCAAGSAWSYPAGCATGRTTYTDATAGTPNPNPVILDIGGKASVWIGPSVYKFVLTDSLGNVQWTQDGVSDPVFVYMHALTLVGDSALLSYVGPGSGASTRSVHDKLAELGISVSDFGAVCDGAHAVQDTAAFQAAITYVGTGGGIIHVPIGTCLINSTLTIPRATRLIGANSANSILKAGPLFPINSAMIRIGDPALTSTALHYAAVEDLTVDMNYVAGSTAIYSNRAQELTYLNRLLIMHYEACGINYESFGIQNTSISNIYMAGGTSAAGVGIRVYQGQSRIVISNVTIFGEPVQHTAPAILFDGGSIGDISNIHVETHDIAIELATQSTATISNVQSHSTVSTVVQIDADANGGTVTNITNTGASGSKTVDDQNKGVTILASDAYILPFYSSGWTTSGNLITTAQNFINRIKFVTAQTLHIENGSIDLGIGATTNSKFYTDPSSMNMFGTGPIGILLQKLSGPTQGIAGGGLNLVGNGYLNSPSLGCIWAGATTDCGTHTARGTTAAGIHLDSGAIWFLENKGLTAGSAFSASPAFKMEDYELRSYGKTFTQLTTVSNGLAVWCQDCTIGATCTGSGAGAWAFRSQGTWKCPF